jgi:hypothetical protein
MPTIADILYLIECGVKEMGGRSTCISTATPKELQKVLSNVPICEVPKSVDRLKEADEIWKRYLERGEKPNLFDLRYISWLPHITATSEYLKFIKQENILLRNRELRGLLFGSLSKLNVLKRNNDALNLSREIFQGASQEHRELWERIETYFLKPEGPSLAAQEIIANCYTPREFLQRRAFISLESGDVYQVIQQGLSGFGKDMLLSEEAITRKWAYEKILPTFGPLEKFRALESCVLGLDHRTNPNAKQELKRFLLEDSSLGDPRLNSGGWVNASEKLKERVIEWLSSEDIRFFFDSIFQVHLDTQGRKGFWMEYASLVKRTRVLLSENDKRKMSHILQREGYETSPVIGSLIDYSRQVNGSVFLMDFGEVIVAEFSVPNNSCRIFKKEKNAEMGSNFWKATFTVSEIRDTRDSWVHSINWASKFRTNLGRLGIRPRGFYDY